MAEQHTFPQNGDNDDAENFGQMIGHDILSDLVITGMGFTVDYTVPEVTIGTGVAAIRVSSDTAPSTGETRLNVTRVVQLPQNTISLTDNDVNHIYVEPDFSTDDNGSFAAYTNTSNASADALKIGEVDTSNDTSTELNRGATAGVDVAEDGSVVTTGSSEIDFTTGITASDDGDGTSTVSAETDYITLNLSTTKLNSGEYAALHRVTVPSGSDIEVHVASINNDSHSTPAGLNLVVRNVTAGSNEVTYNTNYNEGSPITTITGVGGDNVTFAADNGDFTSGTGSTQYVNAVLKVKIV